MFFILFLFQYILRQYYYTPTSSVGVSLYLLYNHQHYGRQNTARVLRINGGLRVLDGMNRAIRAQPGIVIPPVFPEQCDWWVMVHYRLSSIFAR